MDTKAVECLTPLFPGYDCGVKPKFKRSYRRRKKDDRPSGLSVLLFPELYPDEFEILEKEIRLSSWHSLTDDHVLTLQWYMMTQFDLYYCKDDSSVEHYIDYSLWVLLDDENDESPFTYRATVSATLGMYPDNFAGIIALRIMKGSLDYTTKCGDVFRRIRKKYEKKLIKLIVESDISV